LRSSLTPTQKENTLPQHKKKKQSGHPRNFPYPHTKRKKAVWLREAAFGHLKIHYRLAPIITPCGFIIQANKEGLSVAPYVWILSGSAAEMVLV